MSSTGRGGERHPQDFYATPSWCTRRLLEALPLPGGVWLEPCAGEGDIIKAVNEVRTDVTWLANELREECMSSIFSAGNVRNLTIGDILTANLPDARVCITNPPFGIAQQVMEKLLGRYEHLIFLQRVNWLAGPRADLFRKIRPSLYVLPNRPSFVNGTTDSTEYGWFVFDGRGEIKILNDTPVFERKFLDQRSVGHVVNPSRKEPKTERDLNEYEIEYEAKYEYEPKLIQQYKNEQGEMNMAGLPRDMAQQVGNARTTGGGNYIQHGNYIFLIKKWFFQLSPQKERCIIVEFLVIDAQGKTVFEGQKAINQIPNAIASDCSEVSNWDGAGKLSAPANSRAVVLGLFGFKENEVPDDKVVETLDTCIGDGQPAAGMLIACSTFSKEKRTKPGEYITGRNWDCVARPGTGVNAPDQVAARMNLLRTSPVKCVQLARQQLGLAAFDEKAVETTTAAPSSNGGGMFASTPAPQQAAFTGFAAPTAPEAPAVPAVPAAPDPFAGWTKHPTTDGYWYRGQVVKSEADLLAGR